jgi:hypothetical protein
LALLIAGDVGLQDAHLLENASEVDNRTFIDGRRFIVMPRLPDLRQLTAGQNRERSGRHFPPLISQLCFLRDPLDKFRADLIPVDP